MYERKRRIRALTSVCCCTYYHRPLFCAPLGVFNDQTNTLIDRLLRQRISKQFGNERSFDFSAMPMYKYIHTQYTLAFSSIGTSTTENNKTHKRKRQQQQRQTRAHTPPPKKAKKNIENCTYIRRSKYAVIEKADVSCTNKE